MIPQNPKPIKMASTFVPRLTVPQLEEMVEGLQQQLREAEARNEQKSAELLKTQREMQRLLVLFLKAFFPIQQHVKKFRSEFKEFVWDVHRKLHAFEEHYIQPLFQIDELFSKRDKLLLSRMHSAVSRIISVSHVVGSEMRRFQERNAVMNQHSSADRDATNTRALVPTTGALSWKHDTTVAQAGPLIATNLEVAASALEGVDTFHRLLMLRIGATERERDEAVRSSETVKALSQHFVSTLNRELLLPLSERMQTNDSTEKILATGSPILLGRPLLALQEEVYRDRSTDNRNQFLTLEQMKSEMELSFSRMHHTITSLRQNVIDANFGSLQEVEKLKFEKEELQKKLRVVEGSQSGSPALLAVLQRKLSRYRLLAAMHFVRRQCVLFRTRSVFSIVFLALRLRRMQNKKIANNVLALNGPPPPPPSRGTAVCSPKCSVPRPPTTHGGEGAALIALSSSWRQYKCSKPKNTTAQRRQTAITGPLDDRPKELLPFALFIKELRERKRECQESSDSSDGEDGRAEGTSTADRSMA